MLRTDSIIHPPTAVHRGGLDATSGVGTLTREDDATICVRPESKNWAALAVGSLVVAGLLSLAVVIGRLPILSGLIGDPLFFKRCLVVHVDLALVVWFYAFTAGLTGLRLPETSRFMVRATFGLSIAGVVAMLAGALMRGAEPILANYVPVIDHPLFLVGLAAFFLGVVVYFVHTLSVRSAPADIAFLPSDAGVGLQAAGIAIVLAAATWVSAQAGMPGGLDAKTYYEFSIWGAGHVLQVANVAAMLAVWLWLLAKATGRSVLSTGGARVLFGVLLAPHFIMPLLTMRGTLNNLYHSGATELMRWGIFPIVLVTMFLGVRHLWCFRQRGSAGIAQPEQSGMIETTNGAARVARIGFFASVGLSVFGIVLGACIRTSTTMVPAHYHASLGAVTVAFMAAAYLLCDAAAPEGLLRAAWNSARRQLIWFGFGQSVFALGFAIGGAYGLGRKTYGAEQHVRSSGEIVGLIVMSVGGLVAAAAGIWFLILVIREMRGWWNTRRVALQQSTVPSTP